MKVDVLDPGLTIYNALREIFKVWWPICKKIPLGALWGNTSQSAGMDMNTQKVRL
jgi:hypothetical protein